MHLTKSLKSLTGATLAVAMCLMPAGLEAAEYQYDPNGAAATLEQAGVFQYQQVLDYLALRDSAHQTLQDLEGGPGVAFAIMEEFEAQEQAFQDARNNAGAPGSELAEITAYRDFVEQRYQTYVSIYRGLTFADKLTLFHPLTDEAPVGPAIMDAFGDSLTHRLEKIENGDMGLALMANAVFAPDLYSQFASGLLSGDQFVLQVKALAQGINPGIWDEGMTAWETIAATYFTDRDQFFNDLSVIGVNIREITDHFQQQAQVYASLSQVTGLKGADQVNDADVYLRAIADALAQGLYDGGLATLQSAGYLTSRKAAFEEVYNQVGDFQTTSELLESVEYTFEQWELDARQRAAKLNGLSFGGQIMDAVDAGAGRVWSAVLMLGHQEHSPYPNAADGNEFAANWFADAQAIDLAIAQLQDGAASEDIKEDIKKWVREAKRIKKTVQDYKKKLKELLKKIKEILEIVEKAKKIAKDVKDALPGFLTPDSLCDLVDLLCIGEDVSDIIEEIEEILKEICKWLKVACVILDAACEILEILCE